MVVIIKSPWSIGTLIVNNKHMREVAQAIAASIVNTECGEYLFDERGQLVPEHQRRPMNIVTFGNKELTMRITNGAIMMRMPKPFPRKGVPVGNSHNDDEAMKLGLIQMIKTLCMQIELQYPHESAIGVRPIFLGQHTRVTCDISAQQFQYSERRSIQPASVITSKYADWDKISGFKTSREKEAKLFRWYIYDYDHMSPNIASMNSPAFITSIMVDDADVCTDDDSAGLTGVDTNLTDLTDFPPLTGGKQRVAQHRVRAINAGWQQQPLLTVNNGLWWMFSLGNRMLNQYEVVKLLIKESEATADKPIISTYPDPCGMYLQRLKEFCDSDIAPHEFAPGTKVYHVDYDMISEYLPMQNKVKNMPERNELIPKYYMRQLDNNDPMLKSICYNCCCMLYDNFYVGLFTEDADQKLFCADDGNLSLDMLMVIEDGKGRSRIRQLCATCATRNRAAIPDIVLRTRSKMTARDCIDYLDTNAVHMKPECTRDAYKDTNDVYRAALECIRFILVTSPIGSGDIKHHMCLLGNDERYIGISDDDWVDVISSISIEHIAKTINRRDAALVNQWLNRVKVVRIDFMQLMMSMNT